MLFCNQCRNMLYLRIYGGEESGDSLAYYCRHCHYEDEQTTVQAAMGSMVLSTNYKKTEQPYHHIINAYTKLDPTLPRIYNMKCPSAECPTNHPSTSTSTSTALGKDKDKDKDSSDNHNHNNEIIYMRYDDDNMKYLYICSTCDTVWKTDDKA